MAKDKYCTKYVLLETNSLDTILSPLKATQRIKYTCFDVSQNFIVFGATSGGLYIFSRDPCHFLQLLPNKDGSLTNVSISPDEKFVGFSTGRGIAAILERSDEGGAFLISRSEQHGGTNITSLTWSDASNQLYIADNSGQLSVINISLFINKSIFQLPSHIIIKLDSEIFQVSCCGELLLASTRTRCYLCDTVKEQYKQIGSKLREGVFGASFIKYPEGVVKAFCARPGSRLWEVDSEGSVLCTHQFKEALTMSPSVSISIPENNLHKSQFPYWQEQAVNFPYLFPIMEKYLFTFKQDSFHIFDPEKVELIAQCNKYTNVVDARCVANTIYTWNSNGTLQEFVLTSVENCLLSLYFRQAYSLCVELCEIYADYIEALEYNKLITLSPLLGLSDHIDNLHLNNHLTCFFVNLNNCCNVQSFKLNLNDTLETKFKLPQVCDKSEMYLSNNGHVEEKNELVITSCLCQDQAEQCIHDMLSDNKKNSILSFLDNNIHQNAYLADNNLSSYVSSESSPDVSISFTSQNFYSNLLDPNERKNVQIKLGTKNLMDKWQVSNDKLNSIKSGDNLSRQLSSLNLSDSDESIVAGRQIKENHTLDISTVDYSSLLEICDIFIKSDNNCKVELFAHFLKNLFQVNIEYKNTLVNHKTQGSKMFSLKNCLPEQCIKVLSNCFCDIVNGGHLMDCLNCLPKEIMKAEFLPIKYPNFLLTMYCSSELELDTAISNILYMIVDILDPFIILDLIDSMNLPCSFMSWYAVVEAFQDNTFDYITVPQDSYKFNDWPLPVILNIIYLMLRLDQVESASYISREIHISVKNISYLIFRLYLQLEASATTQQECSIQCDNLFLRYLSSLTQINDNLIKDLSSETVQYIENAIVNVSDITVCHFCNFPVVRKKTDISCYSAVGDLLLQYYLDVNLLVNNTCDIALSEAETNSVDNILEASSSESFSLEKCNLYKCLIDKMSKDSVDKIINLVKVMPNVIVKLFKSNFCTISEILEFIAQFNLINNLNTFCNSLNHDNWIVLCDLYKDMSQSLCCICHKQSMTPLEQVDWNSLATSMLHSLGPSSSVKILMQYAVHIPPGLFDMSFYRTTLLSDLMTCSTPHTSSYKDIMSTYQSQFIREPIDSHLSQMGVVSMWEAESSDDSSESLTPHVVHSTDRKHWGITLDINFDVCSKCSLVLNSEKLLQEGIRSFKCGHTYHVLCLRLSNSLFECSVCL